MNTRNRKLLFSLITIALPLVFILLLELVLRLITPPAYGPMVTEVKYDTIDWYQLNRSYLKKYFPANARLIPEFKPSLFRKEKQKQTYRVFCLGGSSMFGTPYQMTSNIPGIVRRQLRYLYPDLEIEVINLGASAINSHVVKRMVDDVLQFDPDLILIYMGHNEFYGPDGVGATGMEKRLPFLVDLKYALREVRIYQLLRKWLTPSLAELSENEERNLMREVSRGSYVSSGSGDEQRVFRLFAENLAEIISTFQKNDVPVIVSDVVSNLSFAPFAYPSEVGDISLDDYSGKMNTLYEKQDFGAALQELKDLQTQQPGNAMINFWIGKCYFALEQPDSARKYFQLARDFDLLKFRAPAKINDIIEEICLEQDVPFVSSEAFLSELSEKGITGFDLFWEHLHPNTAGYYWISRVFLDQIQEGDLIKIPPAHPPIPFDMHELNICWLDLAYADISIQNLTGKWPFKEMTVPTEYLNKADPRLVQIARDVYQRKIVWDDGCYRTAAVFEKNGIFKEAETTYQAILEEYPYNFYAHYMLGRLYRDNNQLYKAAEHYRISVASNERYLNSHMDLGLILINLGLFDRAIENLKTALSLMSSRENPAVEANINYGLAAAFANKRDLETALVYVNRALEVFPDYPAAKALKQSLLRVKEAG